MGIIRAIASTLVLVVFFYISHQLTRFTSLQWHWQMLIISFLALMFVMVIGTFLYHLKDRTSEPSPRKDFLLNIALTAMAYINFLITFVLLRDIVAFADHLFHFPDIPEIYSTQATAALLSTPLLLLLLGHGVIRFGARHKKVHLPFSNLPEELNGLRIMHVTDLHIGASLPSQFVEKLVQKINKAQPDMIVFTGDILDGIAEKHAEDLRQLKALKADLGIYYVTGNHEFHWGAPQCIQAFKQLGFHVLENTVVEIQRGSASLQIAGVPDPSAKHFQMEGPDFARLQKEFKEHSFKVLLSHQPSLAKIAHQFGFDLQLSGHTHGGQFFPWNFLIVFFERYAKGLYKVGNMQLYVNQGTGYWGPQLRLGTYCELAEIILRKEAKKG